MSIIHSSQLEIVLLEYTNCFFGINQKLIRMKNSEMFCTKCIHIPSKKFLVCCNSVNRTVKAALQRYIDSDCKKMPTNTIVSFVRRLCWVAMRSRFCKIDKYSSCIFSYF